MSIVFALYEGNKECSGKFEFLVTTQTHLLGESGFESLKALGGSGHSGGRGGEWWREEGGRWCVVGIAPGTMISPKHSECCQSGPESAGPATPPLESGTAAQDPKRGIYSASGVCAGLLLHRSA